jgi:hypothetical protein
VGLRRAAAAGKVESSAVAEAKKASGA